MFKNVHGRTQGGAGEGSWLPTKEPGYARENVYYWLYEIGSAN